MTENTNAHLSSVNDSASVESLIDLNRIAINPERTFDPLSDPSVLSVGSITNSPGSIKPSNLELLEPTSAQPSPVSASSPDVLTELTDYIEEFDVDDEDTTMLDSEKEEEEESL